MADHIEHFDVTLMNSDEKNLLSGAKKILRWIKVDWPEKETMYKIWDEENRANRIVKFWNSSDHDDKNAVLVKIFGSKTGLIIDRKTEQFCMRMAQLYDLAPPFYCTFNDGFAYGFMPGQPLTLENFENEQICKLVMQKLACFHSVKPVNVHQTNMFDHWREPVFSRQCKKFAKIVGERFDSSNKQFVENFGSVNHIRLEIEFLENQLLKLDSPIVFCHNDLALRNIIIDGNITFVDYKFAGPNFQSFDIANLLMNVADMKENVNLKSEFTQRLLKEYLMVFNKLNRKAVPVDSDVQKLLCQVEASFLATYFFWTLWSLAWSFIIENPKIDYFQRSLVLMKRYQEIKARTPTNV